MARTYYEWDEVNDTLLRETDEAGNTIAEYTHEPTRYGPLLSQRRNGHTYYHHYDGLGNTRALTDESGHVTDRYSYDAWGNQIAHTGTTTNPFGYKGALGYYANPEATARAWRNGWFHTGDAFRRDEAGNFFFVDRLKDAIRRRGENISSFEVEKEIAAHPDVRDAAVVGVPSEFGEDEVLAVLSAAPDRTIDLPELVRFLVPRLAHFMVPRYFRIVADLPRTPTEKVQKHLLRADGITADTWDREAAGIVLKRERLRS